MGRERVCSIGFSDVLMSQMNGATKAAEHRSRSTVTIARENFVFGRI